MKLLFRLCFFIAILALVYSCKLSQRELAVIKIDQAQKKLDACDTMSAINILDSISILFPKAKFQIEVSHNMKDELYRQLIDLRKEQLKRTDQLISEMEKNFIIEKTEFDLYTQYIPLEQSKIRTRNITYLQVSLDERGEMYLTSNYYGKSWANHSSIKVYDEDIYAETSPVDAASPYRKKSSFLDFKWEKVSFTAGNSDSVIKFISQNNELPLKCAFNSYIIFLDKNNIQAICNSYRLSEAIKYREKIKVEIRKLEKERSLI